MANDKNDQDAGAVGERPARAEAVGDGFIMFRGAVGRALVKSQTSAVRFRDRTRSVAGPALTKTAIELRLAGTRGATGLSAFYRERLHPFLNRAGRWIGRRLHPRSLIRDYRRVLLIVHRLGPDRAVERLFFVPTANRIPLAIVRVPHQLRRTGHDYRPTPRLVFEWAMEAIPEPLKRFEFVDYGAGRGRALLMASHYPFEKITGAEIAEELYNDCLQNIAQYPRSLMKCRDVNCEHLSALRLDVPGTETVFFLNNPFDRSMLERVIGQIVRTYKQEPRRFYVICVDIREPDLFEDTSVFEAVPVPFRLRLRSALLSPYTITVYRTVH